MSVRVTITEAATLLGVHPNTVRGRVKAGLYDAEKVATEYGLTWMIDLNSLVNEPLPRDSQHAPSQVVNPNAVTPMEMVQDLLRPFVEDLGKVREELGAEKVRREQAEKVRDEAERERDELLARLEALASTSEPRDAPETPPDASEGATPHPDTVEAQEGAGETEETARRPWWIRWFGG